MSVYLCRVLFTVPLPPEMSGNFGVLHIASGYIGLFFDMLAFNRVLAGLP